MVAQQAALSRFALPDQMRLMELALARAGAPPPRAGRHRGDRMTDNPAFFSLSTPRRGEGQGEAKRITKNENFKIWRYFRRIRSKYPNLVKHFKRGS